MATLACPQCHARYRSPASAEGKKVKCARCGAIFIGQLAQASVAMPPSPPPEAAAITHLPCPQCNTKMRIPPNAAGKRAKCPHCGAILNIPAESAAMHVDADALVYQLAAAEAAFPAVPSASHRVAAPAPPEQKFDGPTCPGCRNPQPTGAKICVDCGISLATGRSILMTQDDNLDSIYAVAESTIRWISWLIFFGIYPIASEAFGLYKPWVIRAVALITTVTSFAFLGFMWTDAPAMASLQDLMLWCGNPAVVEEALSELKNVPDGEVNLDGATREEVEAAIREHLAASSQFHPYQLITHAFLHGGILHLAGNLLFLMVLGTRVNALVGNLWTLGLYPLLAILSGVAQRLSSMNDPPYPAIGASGAIMGLAGMYLVLFPAHKVHMAVWLRWGIFLPLRLSLRNFAVRGFWVVLFYIAFDMVYTMFGLEDDVAHWAHLGGFGAGVIIAVVLLTTRLVNARGGDLFSVVLGRRAWVFVGRPRQ